MDWGLSGPDFLLLYGVALVVVVAFAVYLRWAVRRPRLAEPGPVADANLVAYLAGGEERVVETALARLVEQGAVRVTRKGMVTRTTDTVADPLDQAVLTALGGRTREVADLVRRAVGATQVTGVATSAAARGLAISPARSSRARRGGVLAMTLLLVVGVVRLVTGIAGGYPVGHLVIELLVTGVVLVVLLTTGRGVDLSTVHRAGVLKAAREATDTANRVAVGGLGAYPDTAVATALLSTRRPPGTSRYVRGRTVRAANAGGAGYVATAHSCGSTASSCGSSSGGSSCGGGGCGGGGA